MRYYSVRPEDQNTELYKHLTGKGADSLSKLQPKETDQYELDQRSGEDLSDTDKEFDSIMEIDHMLKDLAEGTFEESEVHAKLLNLFNKLYELRELIEFDSDALKQIVGKMIPQEILFFGSYSSMITVAKLAHLMEMPYQEFW